MRRLGSITFRAQNAVDKICWLQKFDNAFRVEQSINKESKRSQNQQYSSKHPPHHENVDTDTGTNAQNDYKWETVEDNRSRYPCTTGMGQQQEQTPGDTFANDNEQMLSTEPHMSITHPQMPEPKIDVGATIPRRRLSVGPLGRRSTTNAR